MTIPDRTAGNPIIHADPLADQVGGGAYGAVLADIKIARGKVAQREYRDCHVAVIARFDPALVRDKRALLADLGLHREQVVDARAAGRFDGSAEETWPGRRRGHIPGSRNVPFDEVTDPRTRQLKSAEELRGLFENEAVGFQMPHDHRDGLRRKPGLPCNLCLRQAAFSSDQRKHQPLIIESDSVLVGAARRIDFAGPGRFGRRASERGNCIGAGFDRTHVPSLSKRRLPAPDAMTAGDM